MEPRQSAVSEDFLFSDTISVKTETHLNSESNDLQNVFSGSGAVWLEVYRFPTAAWLEEFEMVPSQKQVMNCNLI